MSFPSPSWANMQEMYDALHRQEPVLWDDAAKDRYVWSMIHLYLRASRRGVPSHMLDIGCGSGHTLEYFSAKWPQTRLFGLDLSPAAIESAKKKVPQADLFADSLESLILQREYDLIIMLGVLEHFLDPLQALKKIRSLVSPKGLIYVEVPHNLSYPGTLQEEGFRPLSGGSRQWEWHLFRESWEEKIRASELEILLPVRGPRPTMEFAWVLGPKKETVCPWTMKRIQTYEGLSRLKEQVPSWLDFHSILTGAVDLCLRALSF